MSRNEALRLIEAGAIVEGTLDGDTVDLITARRYRHPALDDRVVVTLVPDTLGPAEDLALEFLGFQADAEPVTVGSGRRQALGFPAWALINDPVNGHHALALVKDIERLARLAKSKPGLAREGFDELGERLGQAVPHFLPTYYEQAGRAFVVSDNRQTAAQMFGRARQAEQVYALAIDEDRQRDVFLEFAFNGALTAKSLTQHSKDLALRAEPEAAYELFLRVTQERVAGGLPPYAGMAGDLRRLARAAKLPAAEQDRRVIRSLLDAPALAHAPLPFWMAYVPALTALAKVDLSIRTRLFDLLPVTSEGGIEDLWLDLLAGTGAEAGLIEVADDPALARPRDGAAGWLVRAVRWRGRGWRSSGRWDRLLDLAERMAPRLRAEGKPLALFDDRGTQIDLDLLDLCVSLDLPIAVPAEVGTLALWTWVSDERPGRRDLTALARTDWARGPLLSGLRHTLQSQSGRNHHWQNEGSSTISRAQAEHLVSGVGLREIVALWLEQLADQADASALPGLEETLDQLAPGAIDIVLGASPAAVARIRALDAGRALARTLRIGLFDELGWPALESATARFPELPAQKMGHMTWPTPRFETSDAWPALVLTSRTQVVVVGPEGELLRHDVRIPPAHPVGYGGVSAAYVDGQVLVYWSSQTARVGYWSARPDEVFEIKSELRYGILVGGGLPLPGGGRTTGGRPLLPGDTTFSTPRAVAFDGEHWWRLDEPGWREYDPRTGDPGRLSRPAFFEAALARGDEAVLLADQSRLAPIQPGLEQTPLGTADGMLGWRAVRLPDGTQVGESVNGVTVRRSPPPDSRRSRDLIAGALQLPGGGPPVTVLAYGSGYTLAIGDLDGSWVWQSGPDLVPPIHHWHALRPRDEVGSAFLRTVTDSQAQELLAAAQRVPIGTELTATVSKVFGQISHPKLVAGVARALAAARERAAQIQALPAGAAAPVRIAAVDAPVTKAAWEAPLSTALAGLTSRYSAYNGGQSEPRMLVLDSLRAAVELIRTPPKKGLLARLTQPAAGSAGRFPVTKVEWATVVGGLGAIALRAASPATEDAERPALLALLAAVRETPLAEPDGCWRAVTLSGPNRGSAMPGTVLKTATGQVVILDGSMIWHGNGTEELPALEHSPTGNFGAVSGYTVLMSRPNTGWGGADRIAELIELISTRGPAPWFPESVDALVQATGMSRAEAGLLLAGLPGGQATEHNFLSKSTREMLGLKVAEAAAAVPTLRELDPSRRLFFLGLAMPEKPAELWERGPNVEALAAGWIRLFGRRAAVPEYLVTELTALRSSEYGSVAPAKLLQALADPTRDELLSRDLKWTVDGHHATSTGGVGFSGPVLTGTITALAWLAYRLPQGDPFRCVLGIAFDAIRQRAAHPDLLIPVLCGFDVGGLRAAYGHPPQAGPAGGRQAAEVLELGEGGLLVNGGWQDFVYVRPGKLGGPTDPLLQAGLGLLDPASAALRALTDPDYLRLVESLSGKGDFATPGWAQDPLISVPELVSQVAERLGVDPDAARLYLQLLTLPDPSDKNVQRWNEWTAKQLKSVTAQLRSAELVVDGKRARAGRTAFLPCGWLDLKAPAVPIETWKVPLLGLLPGGHGPLGLSVPTVPVAELFHRAWERVLADDGPQLEQFESGRRR